MFEKSTLGEPAQEAQALKVNCAWLLDEHLKRGIVGVLADHGLPSISANGRDVGLRQVSPSTMSIVTWESERAVSSLSTS